MTTDCITIETTFDDLELATRVRIGLVENRLAAGAKVRPVESSTYRWEGKIDDTKEYVLTAQTTVDRYQAAEDYIVENHNYKLACVTGHPITHGKAEFLQWIRDCVSPTPTQALAQALDGLSTSPALQALNPAA